MSVYINGLKMPKNGEYKKIILCGDGDVLAEDNYAKIGTFVHVPEHGRLIDADALPVSTAVPLNGKSYKYVHIDNISIAPTIIPADIKTTYYPQVDGITPTVIKPKKEETE